MIKITHLYHFVKPDKKFSLHFFVRDKKRSAASFCNTPAVTDRKIQLRNFCIGANPLILNASSVMRTTSRA